MNIIKQILLKPFISITPLENLIGCPKGTIHQWLKGHRETISPRWIWAMTRELSQAGFILDGWVIEYEHGVFSCRKDQDKPATIIEHRKKASGEIYSVENPPDEDPDPDYTSSWFEYRQSQSRVTLTNELELRDFLESLEKEKA